MPYKYILRIGVAFCLAAASYFVGEHRGLKQGVEISAVFAQSGRSVDQANMIALLLAFSRRGEEEKMYELGEKFIVKNMETYNSVQRILDEASVPIKNTELYETLDVMVNSFPHSTTKYYIKKYINDGEKPGDEPSN